MCGAVARAALCPSLVSSPGNVRTSRGRQMQLDRDLSSGALRQIKVRHLMRGDQGDLSSCSKSCFSTSTHTHTHTRLDCPTIPTTGEVNHFNSTSGSTKGKSNTSQTVREKKKRLKSKQSKGLCPPPHTHTPHTHTHGNQLWNFLFPFQSCLAASGKL